MDTATAAATQPSLKDWVSADFRNSGIPDRLWKINAKAIAGDDAIEALCETAIASVQSVTSYVTEPAKRILRKHEFARAGGWIAYGCKLDGSVGAVAYFKPMTPGLDQDGDPIKYPTPQGCPAEPLLTLPDEQTAADIYQQYGITPLEGESFWQVVKRCNVPVAITEGLKKAMALIANGMPAIALRGVYCWHKKGVETLHDAIAHFATPDREICIIFDQDTKPKTIAAVKKQVEKLGQCLTTHGAVVSVATWPKELGKGIDDALVHLATDHGQDAGKWLHEQVIKNAVPIADYVGEGKAIGNHPQLIAYSEGKDGEVRRKQLPASAVARILDDESRELLAWNTDEGCFYRYNADPTRPGVWIEEPKAHIMQWLQSQLDARGASDTYSAGYVSSIYELLANYRAVRSWDEVHGLLPMLNGVLDLKTNKLLPHSPGYRFTWQLPYSYSPMATCEPITQWLMEAQDSDRDRVQLLRAYLKAVVMGRSDLQRYLECLGPGGSGKSTFANLAVALVGLENVAITDFEQLEKNRFETSRLKGKRLILITDSDRYGGSVAVFKAITGGDFLRNEQKFKQQSKPFTCQAMAIVVANEPIASTDYTSGLERRRITVPFLNRVQPSKRRDLLTANHAGVSGEFVEHLPGLLNWVLAMPDDEMVRLVRETALSVPSLNRWKAETLVETNPIAEWLDLNCILGKDLKTYIGKAERERITVVGEGYETKTKDVYRNRQKWLYANYCQFCKDYGPSKGIISMQRFSRLVVDLLREQLGVSATKGRDSSGSFIQGIGLRVEGTDAPHPITGMTVCDNSVTERVTTETRTHDSFDGYDGYFSIQFDSKIQEDPPLDDFHSQQDTAPKPSSSSELSYTRVSAVTPVVTPLPPTVRVGDRVCTLEDHHATVIEIAGDMAKLDGPTLCGWRSLDALSPVLELEVIT